MMGKVLLSTSPEAVARRVHVRSIAPPAAPTTMPGVNDPRWSPAVTAEVERVRRAIFERFAPSVFKEKLAPGGPPVRESDVRAPPVIEGATYKKNDRPLPLTPEQQAFIKQELEELERLGIIMPIQHSDFSTPLFVVDKDRSNPNPRKWYRMVFD